MPPGTSEDAGGAVQGHKWSRLRRQKGLQPCHHVLAEVEGDHPPAGVLEGKAIAQGLGHLEHAEGDRCRRRCSVGQAPRVVGNRGVEGARRDGSIVMYDQQLKEVARWNFERAWPVKVTGPQPKADSNEIGVEELTLAHEYIERVS